MNEEIDPVSAVQYLDKELAARTLVAMHIEGLRAGIGSGDPDLLAPALISMYQDLSLFPDHKFLAVELFMMLAANTEGDLKVGVGEI